MVSGLDHFPEDSNLPQRAVAAYLVISNQIQETKSDKEWANNLNFRKSVKSVYMELKKMSSTAPWFHVILPNNLKRACPYIHLINNTVSGGAFVTASTKESSWLNVELV